MNLRKSGLYEQLVAEYKTRFCRKGIPSNPKVDLDKLLANLKTLIKSEVHLEKNLQKYYTNPLPAEKLNEPPGLAIGTNQGRQDFNTSKNEKT